MEKNKKIAQGEKKGKLLKRKIDVALFVWASKTYSIQYFLYNKKSSKKIRLLDYKIVLYIGG